MSNVIMRKAMDFVFKKSLPLQKKAPEILMGAGLLFGAGSLVTACIATRKLDEVIEDVQIDIEAAKSVHENESIPELGRTDQDLRKDIVMAYGKGAFRIAKLYAPSAALGAASVLSILSSHNILSKRNVAIAAAYSVLESGFEKYRENVIDKFGEEVDRQMRYGIEKVKETESVTDSETGKTKKVKKEIDVVGEEGIEGYSIYARFYDDSCRTWRRDPEYNLMYLRSQQAAANEILKAKGILTLNEVYEMLDIPRTQAGQIVGWVDKEDNPNGDNKVDFGIYNIRRRANRDFVNGYEDVILLDFNVDGVVWDQF